MRLHGVLKRPDFDGPEGLGDVEVEKLGDLEAALRVGVVIAALGAQQMEDGYTDTTRWAEETGSNPLHWSPDQESVPSSDGHEFPNGARARWLSITFSPNSPEARALAIYGDREDGQTEAFLAAIVNPADGGGWEWTEFLSNVASQHPEDTLEAAMSLAEQAGAADCGCDECTAERGE